MGDRGLDGLQGTGSQDQTKAQLHEGKNEMDNKPHFCNTIIMQVKRILK